MDWVEEVNVNNFVFDEGMSVFVVYKFLRGVVYIILSVVFDCLINSGSEVMLVFGFIWVFRYYGVEIRYFIVFFLKFWFIEFKSIIKRWLFYIVKCGVIFFLNVEIVIGISIIRYKYIFIG